jgi:2',3'-cyclic-nucleotide 2'-phosphodiesterase (5'-nucleotidase family)
MKHWVVKFLSTMILLPLVAVGSETGTVPLTFIYSGNLDGELEPCGCSEEGNLGGIKRRVTTIDRLREEQPDMVAVSAGGLIASEGVTDRIKSEYILKGFEALGYDAIGVQWRDLSYGAEFITVHELPWVSSNWDQSYNATSKTIERTVDGRNVRFEIFSWLDPNYSPMRQMHGDHTMVSDDVSKINQRLSQTDKAGAVTVLTTTLPLEQAQSLFALQHVDILFIKANYEEFGEPTRSGKTLVLQPGSRGMRIARLDLHVNAEGDVAKWNNTVIPMPDKVADAPRMAQWYAEYNAKVKEDYLKRVEIRKQRESGQSSFAGEEQCKTCHQSQYEVWFDSQHAIAFEELEAVNKAFDPACIGCHTVGFNQPGGYVDMSITSHLIGVQCESCHGAGREHAESGGAKPVANHQWSKEKMCGQCHVQKHSPSFNVETYWPKIAH